MPVDRETLLFPAELSSSETIVVNARCHIVQGAEMRVVMFAGVPVARLAPGDREAEDLFVAQALENGFSKPGELSKALGRPIRTVQRVHLRYVQGGIGGLVLKKRGPQGPRLGEWREDAIRRLHGQGLAGAVIARRLGVSQPTVSRALARQGLSSRTRGRPRQAGLFSADPEPTPESVSLPGAAAPDVSAADAARACGTGTGSEDPAPAADDAHEHGEETDTAAVKACERAAVSSIEDPEDPEQAQRCGLPVSALGLDPLDRSVDRAMAAVGLIDDAAPLFAVASGVPRAGVLLAVPFLVGSGLFDVAEKAYRTIGPAFYGLRTILLTLVFLGLLRIKRPENVKEYSPPELGRIIGLDRAPEVKTIRRKLVRMARSEQALANFADGLVRRRVERASEALGYLYADGHVRVYNGKHDLPKAHVARMRISLPASQDVWINDADGSPLFFVTQEGHPQLVSALRKILPDVRKLVGKRRRPTVVFDRGGWSPELFKWMANKMKFDVLTYRKGKADPIPAELFTTYEVALPGGKEKYELADTEIQVAKGFKMRQVTRRQGDHQTHIVTSRRDLPVTEVAIRMFNRWRQENFFKYMREEFAIDALVEYGVQAADAERLVPNPERKALDKQLRQAKADVVRFEAAFGAAAADNEEARRPTMRGFKIANSKLGIGLQYARAKVAVLTQTRRNVPTKVPIGQIKDQVVRLKMHRKRLSDTLKMLAYQVETDMVRAVSPYYARCLDEGRTLISAALMSTADVEPRSRELRITLAPQSSPHRSHAIAQLCDILNATETCFPGTDLRLRYAIRGDDRAT